MPLPFGATMSVSAKHSRICDKRSGVAKAGRRTCSHSSAGWVAVKLNRVMPPSSLGERMPWIYGLLAVAAIVAPVVCNAQTVHLVAADLASPFGVAFDAKGNLLILEYTSSLRALTPDGKIVAL